MVEDNFRVSVAVWEDRYAVGEGIEGEVSDELQATAAAAIALPTAKTDPLIKPLFAILLGVPSIIALIINLAQF